MPTETEQDLEAHYRMVMSQHFNWLRVYAIDDADHQRRNYLDNMALIRRQVAQMERDFEKAMRASNPC